MDKVSGLDQMHAAVQKLKADLAKQLPAIVAQAAQPLLHEIQARMPVDTGKLESSLDMTSSATPGRASAIVQVDNSGPERDEHYAIFKEYGTSKMAAEPFFRPGIEAGKAAVAQQLVNGVLQVVGQHAS